jgi:hypothetical protein
MDIISQNCRIKIWRREEEWDERERERERERDVIRSSR